MNNDYELEATELNGNRYAVRPKGQLGTCGWHPKAWTVIYVTAGSKVDAIHRAKVWKRYQQTAQLAFQPGYESGS